MKFKRSFLRTSNHFWLLAFLLFFSSSAPFPYQFLDQYSRNNIFERKLASKREISRIHGAARQFRFPPHWSVASSPVAGLTLYPRNLRPADILFLNDIVATLSSIAEKQPILLPLINPSLYELELKGFGGKYDWFEKEIFFFFGKVATKQKDAE